MSIERTYQTMYVINSIVGYTFLAAGFAAGLYAAYKDSKRAKEMPAPETQEENVVVAEPAEQAS